MDAAFAEWARGCDLLVLECSLPQSMAIAEHLTPEQCGEIARLAEPRRLALTHLYPPVEQVEGDIATIVARTYNGPLVIAHDGWQADLGD
jgi:ribonuclease BN (tRNA processing enzyme)